MLSRVGLNGIGRIGRSLLRILRDDSALAICAINDLANVESAAHLLRHDSIYGHFPGEVSTRGEDRLVIGDREIPYFRCADPAEIPWQHAELHCVVEATGKFCSANAARGHLRPEIPRVLVTAVCPGADRQIIPGVSSLTTRPNEQILATGSCTTHAAALPLALLDRWYGIESAEMTTVHCTTGSQVTIDQPHGDLRRARSAMLSMIPTSTSASRGLIEALPQLAGRLGCLAIRVPTASVSLIEIVAHTMRDPDAPDAMAGRLREASEGELRGLLSVSEEALVSIDFKGNPHSSIVDLPLLECPGERFVRLIAWYDNEWGYANRVADVLRAWTEDQA